MSTHFLHAIYLKLGLLSTVDELASVHAFTSEEQFLALLVTVRIAEADPSERSSSAGIMHDLLHDSLDVTMAFSEVN